MSSSIIFNQVLVNGAEVWDTRSTANKHTYFCEEDECGNETHSDNKCDSCRAALIAYASGAYEHTCSGELVDDGFSEYYVCDYADSPRCPQTEKHCADCGIKREQLEPVLNCAWYCKPCWKIRFERCTDCGFIPKHGFFPCYRGEEPLCANCEEKMHGPPEDVDWREYTGHCSKCDFFYHMHSSMDRRDLCYICQ